MTERKRIVVPFNEPFDVVVTWADGRTRTLENVHVGAIDYRAESPEATLRGKRWADDEGADASREGWQKGQPIGGASRQEKRAEQSKRDRETFTWRTEPFHFDFKDMPPKSDPFAAHYTKAMDDLYADFFKRYVRDPAPPRQPPPPPPRPTFAGWRTALGYGEHERPSIADVKRRHRQRMASAHPDAGGSHEKAVALNRAMDDAKRELRTVGVR